MRLMTIIRCKILARHDWNRQPGMLPICRRCGAYYFFAPMSWREPSPYEPVPVENLEKSVLFGPAVETHGNKDR